MSSLNIGQRNNDFVGAALVRLTAAQAGIDALRAQVAPAAEGPAVTDPVELGVRNKDVAAAINARITDQQNQIDVLQFIVTGNMPGAITHTVDLSTLDGVAIRDGVWDQAGRAIKA